MTNILSVVSSCVQYENFWKKIKGKKARSYYTKVHVFRNVYAAENALICKRKIANIHSGIIIDNKAQS